MVVTHRAARIRKHDFVFSVPLCLCVSVVNPLAQLLCASVVKSRYRSFSVVRAKSAKTSEAIQKRTITFDSDQPSSSK